MKKGLMTSVLILSLLVLFLAPAPAKSVDLNVALKIPPKHYRITDWWQPYADKIKQGIGGKVKLTLFPSNSLVKSSEAWDAVNAGLSDIVETACYYTPGRFAFEGIITAGLTKGVHRNYAKDNQAIWAAYEKIAEVRREFASVKPLWFFTLMSNYIFSTKPVRNLDDLRGMKLRSNAGSPAVALEKLGAVPVTVPFGETYTAIEKGVVQGVVTQPGGAYSRKFHEVAPHITAIPNTGSITFFVVMNLNKWNSLPKDAQAVFNELGGELQSRRMGELADQMDQKRLDMMLEEGGKLIKLSPTETSKWEDILKVLPVEYGAALDKKGKPGTKTVQFLKQYLESR